MKTNRRRPQRQSARPLEIELLLAEYFRSKRDAERLEVRIGRMRKRIMLKADNGIYGAYELTIKNESKRFFRLREAEDRLTPRAWNSLKNFIGSTNLTKVIVTPALAKKGRGK